MALSRSDAGVTLGAAGDLFASAHLGDGKLLLTLLFGNSTLVLVLVALRLHSVHLVGTAGAELGKCRAREVLVRLQLGEAVRLHSAVVDDQELAGCRRVGAHLAESHARLDPLGIHLGDGGLLGRFGSLLGGAFGDVGDIFDAELLLTASGEAERGNGDHQEESQGLQEFVHEFLLV